MTNSDLARLLFPEVTESVADLQVKYPPRNNNNPVMRMAPSPTGFIHIGGIFTATVDYTFAHQTGGICILRIEDTDQKRQIDDGINFLVNAFKRVNITMDE